MNTARDVGVYDFTLRVAAAAFAVTVWSAPAQAGTVNKPTAELYQLQAAFHRAATVHDPVNGDSAEVIDQRIRDMLSLWTDDGSVTLEVGLLHGELRRPGRSCRSVHLPGSLRKSDESRDPLHFVQVCRWVVQPANKFVSLAPACKTAFGIQGKIATAYFECHYFNVATDPTTGVPLWKAASHLVFDGPQKRPAAPGRSRMQTPRWPESQSPKAHAQYLERELKLGMERRGSSAAMDGGKKDRRASGTRGLIPWGIRLFFLLVLPVAMPKQNIITRSSLAAVSMHLITTPRSSGG